MTDQTKKYGVADILSQHDLASKPETLAVQDKKQSLIIGIPKEITLRENRIALVPSSVKTLVGRGHRVFVEAGAGEKSNFTDLHFSEAGAEICHIKEEVFKAKILLKVAPPTLDEVGLLQSSQILISPLQIPVISKEYINQLIDKRVTAVAMEYMQDDDGSYPIVRILSETAGMSAIHVAAELLSNNDGGPGILLGGISGVPPAKVVILGAGVVAEFATRAALGLGAQVCVFDNNIYKLMRIQNAVGQSLYTSALNPHFIERELTDASVVIGAMHSTSGRTPIIISEEQVMMMKEGSVIIDVSIDQGGCFETSEVTTHDKPTFVKHGVIHYCVPNIASRVSRTASVALSNIIVPILLNAGDTMGMKSMLFNNLGLRHGVYTYKGCLTNSYLSRRFNIKYTNLELLLTSSY